MTTDLPTDADFGEYVWRVQALIEVLSKLLGYDHYGALATEMGQAYALPRLAALCPVAGSGLPS